MSFPVVTTGMRSEAVPLLASFAVASAVLFWALGAFDSYCLAFREGLGRHLLRLTAAFGLGALVLGEERIWRGREQHHHRGKFAGAYHQSLRHLERHQPGRL